jgi:hypothetical protein
MDDEKHAEMLRANFAAGAYEPKRPRLRFGSSFFVRAHSVSSGMMYLDTKPAAARRRDP